MADGRHSTPARCRPPQFDVVAIGASAGGVEALHVVVGASLVQSPAEAQFQVMPNRAIREDDVDAALTLAAIAQALTVMADGGAFEPGSSHPVVP